MLKFSATLSLAFLAASTAYGADMALKAPKASNPYIMYTGSGLYWFGGGFGGATIVDATAGGVGTHLNATGAGVSAGGGYMWGHTTTWTAVDVRVNYATISVDAACGIGTLCAFRRNTSIEARVKYGSDSTKLASLIPSLDLSGIFGVLPVVPANIATPAHPYIFGYGEFGRNQVDIAALDQKKWRGELGAGAGIVHQIGANKALDTWAKCGFEPGSNVAVVGASLKLGATCKGGVDLIF